MLPTKCILFDLDGTLYNSAEYSKQLEAEIVGIVASRLGLSKDEADSTLKEKRREIGTLTGALSSMNVDRTDFFSALAERMDPSLFLSKDPTLLGVLTELKERGFKLGLVSNSGRLLVQKVLQALGVEESVFNATVTSDDAMPKPSSEPFLLALRELKCNIDDAIYVGDRADAELRPAQELGIRTILVSSNGPKSSPWATIVARSIADIPKIVMLTSAGSVGRTREL